jgi:hypothetical protein
MTLLLSPRTVTWLLAIMALIVPAWCWLVVVVVMVVLPVEVRHLEWHMPAVGAKVTR